MGAGLCVFLALAVGPASAMSLGDAVRGALEQTLGASRAAALQAEADAIRLQAGAWTASDPALRVKGLTDRFNSDDGAYEFEAFVDLPMWLPGQRRVRLELANSLGIRADAFVRLLRWEVAGAVRDAVWATKTADVEFQQATAAHEAALALEALVAKRQDAGELARLDLLTAAQETLARQAELTAAQSALEQAKAAYVQVTGRLELPEPANWPNSAQGPSTQASPALPADHPLLAEADAALAGARAERERVASERRGHPVLSLGGKRMRDARSLPADSALQLEVSIPFGLARQAAPELAASERQVTERQAELHRLRREAELELTAAVLGRRMAAEALQVAERRAQLAMEALAVAERAFELGETALADRLRAERRAREASLGLALRRVEQGQALARVNQALGIIPQ